MNSYFKMQENIETYHIFKTIVELFISKYMDKYPFANLLIVIGF